MKAKYAGTPQGQADFNHDWSGSYVGIVRPEYKKLQPVYIAQGVRMPDGSLAADGLLLDGRSLANCHHISFNASEETDFIVPKQHVFQNKDIPYCFTRRIQRQFHRGIHANNSRIRSVLFPEAVADVRINNDAAPVIYRLFQSVDKYPTVKRAIASLEPKRPLPYAGLCISPELSICKVEEDYMGNRGGFGEKGYSLFLCYFDQMVGIIEDDKVVVTKETAYLIPKIADYMEVADVA